MTNPQLDAWNAAVEAAAKVAERQTTDVGFDAQTYNYARRDAAAAIRSPTPPASISKCGEYVMVPRVVVEFLQGKGPLNGVWFSDGRPKGERGAFWWRRYLTAAQPSTDGEG